MNNQYINYNKFKKLANKRKIAVLAPLASLVLFTGSNNLNEMNNKLDDFKNNSSNLENIVNVKIYNYDYCYNDGEFIAFIDDNGNVLKTCKMTGEDLKLYIPSNSSYLESASMGKTVSIPNLDSNYDDYTIELDYKRSFIGTKVKTLDKGKWLLEDDYITLDEEEKEKITSLKDKYNNIDYSEILDIGFKVQGITKIDNTVLITCYDQANSSDFKRNSRIYLYDSITGLSKGYVILNTTSHVGGISFDKTFGILYISSYCGSTITFDLNSQNMLLIERSLDKNTVVDLSGNDIDEKYNMTIDNDICVCDVTNVGRNSTMYACGDNVYVATFNSTNDGMGEVVKFKIDSITDGYYTDNGVVNVWVNKRVDSSILYKRNIPDFTQGVLKTSYEGKDYLITSQSYSNSKSILTVFEEKENRLKYIGSKVIDHPGMESLHIDDNGKIICVFENGQCDIYETNIKKLLGGLDKKEEVLEAIKLQNIYSDIEQTYYKICEDLNIECFDGVERDDVLEVLHSDGILKFLLNILKEIPSTFSGIIEFNSDFIDLLVNSIKVVPREIKVRVLK